MEKTLVLIKPDAVERNLIGKIISIYEANNLKITNMKMTLVTKDIAEEHYVEHKGKTFFDSIINYITRSPIVAMVVEGENAISKVRDLNGPTNPVKKDLSTIRGKYALNVEENSVHASDSSEGAKRELAIWFPNNKY